MSVEAMSAGFAVLVVLLVSVLVIVLRRGDGGLRAALEAGQRAEADAIRASLAATERALATRAEQSRLEAHSMIGGLATQMKHEQLEQRVMLEAKLREMGEQSAVRMGEVQRNVNQRLAETVEKQAALALALAEGQGAQRALLETKLREMGEQSAARLGAIQASVNETLTATVQKTMEGSFQRVADQVAAMQKAMGDVQAVTAQIGDLKRIFTNVKTRGSWGELQLRALLEDVLPAGAWEANRKLRGDSDEVVEFVLHMPSRDMPRPLLAVDAKFPAEDYDRLLLAAEAGDIEGERAARRGLEQRLRLEARKIGSKYIVPPVTVGFAVMYLPTDGLYVEAARMPGLIEALHREHKVMVMGPTLLPALLRTIQIGALSLTIEAKAAEISRLLGAVRGEFGKMDEVLVRLEKQAGSVTSTIGAARVRTRAMERTLRGVEALAADEAAAALMLEGIVEGE